MNAAEIHSQPQHPTLTPPHESLRTSVKASYNVTAISKFKLKENGQLNRSKFKPHVKQDAINNCIGSTKFSLQFLPFDCVRSIYNVFRNILIPTVQSAV